MFATYFWMVSGNGDEGLTSLAPLFGHFVKVSRPAIALQGFILVTGSSEKSTMLKFKYSEEATKTWRKFPVDLSFSTKAKNKSTGRFRQIFVAFWEYMNFRGVPSAKIPKYDSAFTPCQN